MALLVLGACVGLAGSAQGQSSPPSLQAADLYNLETIQSVTLSPSGRNAAYTVRRAVPTPDGDRVYRTQLVVTPTYGRSAPRLLTRSGAGASAPAWHPDGDVLAFVRPVDGTPQIFLLSLSGGEPYQLTDLPSGARQPTWSPDGTRLLFASRVSAPVLARRLAQPPPATRPARTPADTIRRARPQTLLILRDAQTLDPVDTLALAPDGRLQPPADTSRRLRPAPGVEAPAPTQSLRVDSLRALSPDSLRALFGRLGVRPDTTTRPVPPDTAASPDGDLLQLRRWMAQRPPSEAQVMAQRPPNGPATYRHFFLVEVPATATTGHPPRPTPRLVTRDYRSFEGGAWLPGGSQIVVSARPPTRGTAAESDERTLYVKDLSSSRLTRLLRLDGYALSAPRVTTDGTTLAFRAQSLTAPSYNHAEIGLFELDGRSSPQLITADFDHQIGSYRWSPDGWYLYTTAPAQGGHALYRFAPFAQSDTTERAGERTSLRDEYTSSRDTFALDTSMVRTAAHDRVLGPERTVQGVDVTDSKAVYAAATRNNPSELYANTVSFSNETRLTDHNVDWTQSRAFRPSSWLEAWHDGLRIPGRLTPPVRSDTSTAPIVVLPRGGPSPLASSAPLRNWVERQYLSGRGYGVLEVWPRGATGFGESFRRHNFQDWGAGPAGDVMAVLDTARTEFWADSTAVLAGRGYGGSLTAWLVGHTHRFAAAAAQNGVYDLATLFGTHDAATVLNDQFGGPPWSTTSPAESPVMRAAPLVSAGLLPAPDTTTSPRTALRRSSPITHAHRITTPLLLLHDDRGPQASLLYRRLTRLDRPVEYVRYPAGPDPARPAQHVDRLVRLHEFFARFVTPAR
jgi:dipeptidyl aminopeptidase/acylaminoacyl peptidase